jgi:predicted RND superfamily exporter protein
VKLASTFTPLAEMGLVTSLGVALTLAGGLWIIPAILVLTERQQDRKNTAAAG